MDVSFDTTALGQEADRQIQSFQADAAREAGIFHHLITLPTYHTAALSTDSLSEGYFGNDGMLAYVLGVQRAELRRDLAAVARISLTTLATTTRNTSLGKGAPRRGAANTMNQF